MNLPKKERTREVLAVYWDNTFRQYLLKSEIRLILEMCKDTGKRIAVETVTITDSHYKAYFGM